MSEQNIISHSRTTPNKMYLVPLQNKLILDLQQKMRSELRCGEMRQNKGTIYVIGSSTKSHAESCLGKNQALALLKWAKKS